jgi:hypothetical protein
LLGLLAELRRGIARDRAILTAAVAVWIVFLALLASRGVNGARVSSLLINLQLYLAALFLGLALAALALLVRHRPERPLGFLAGAARSSGLGGRLARGAPMLLALAVFMPAFSAMKSAIPLWSDYVWDDTWIRLDRAVHGTDPWRLLQPIFGYPLVTSALSVLYHLWLLLIYAGAAWFCFVEGRDRLRTRFFATYFASWTIMGVGLAILFASVGPCFLAPMLGDGRFEDQMAVLRDANERFPVMTLAVQQQLIDWHLSGSDGLGRGISAMPSMHVSLAFLFFLAMREISRPAGLFFGAFCAIILIGSVYLGYHYAVDGYLAIAATWLIWLAAGRLVPSANDSTEPMRASVPGTTAAHPALAQVELTQEDRP